MDRAPLVLAFLVPLPALAVYQGLLTAGLLPLALFGPVYALARIVCQDPSKARTESVRLTAAATVGAALALVPALLFLRFSPSSLPLPLTGIGVGLTAAGVGTLAGLSAAPPPRRLSREEKRRWTLVETLNLDQARGLGLLFLSAVPLVVGLVLLREAPVFAVGREAGTLPEALFGEHVIDGWLVFPHEASTWLIAIPLSLAPLAVGFLTSPPQATPIAAGGLLAAIAAPMAVVADIATTTAGSTLPLSLHPTPGYRAFTAIAPAGAGLILGAGVAYVGPTLGDTSWTRRALWAAVGALVVLLLQGLLPALLIATGVLAAAVAVTWRTRRAPLGAALAIGAAVGTAVGLVGSMGYGLAFGSVVGIVAGGAVVAAKGARTLLVPEESVRSPITLGYLLVALAVGGSIAWIAAGPVAAGNVPVPAPHARALAAALEALLTSRGDLLLVWGLIAGGLIQWSLGRGALVGVGFLAGPGIGLLVLLGALLRAGFERLLLDRAREGFVMRGELGYELLRVHALVGAVLAAEAIGIAMGPMIGAG